jgi:hypothetical protein
VGPWSFAAEADATLSAKSSIPALPSRHVQNRLPPPLIRAPEAPQQLQLLVAQEPLVVETQQVGR